MRNSGRGAVDTLPPVNPLDRFDSDRHFQVWLYQVGHAQLLVRSVKRRDDERRIDVLSKNVTRIDLPTSFDGLRIQRRDEVFEMECDRWRGRVTAGACFQADDDGEYFDPSPFAESLA
jgi:hypothetical protein